MKKWWLYVSLSCLLLNGCDTNLSKQAIKEAEDALHAQNYQKAKGLIRLASTESHNAEYDALYEQCEALVKMVNYLEAGQLDESLLSWTDINLISAKSTLIKEAAVTELKTMLQEVMTEAEEAIALGETDEVELVIRHIFKRLGDMKLFKEEIAQLQELNQQMN